MRALDERVAAMEQAMGRLQGTLRFWRAVSGSLGAILVAGICIAAVELRGPGAGRATDHFRKR